MVNREGGRYGGGTCGGRRWYLCDGERFCGVGKVCWRRVRRRGGVVGLIQRRRMSWDDLWFENNVGTVARCMDGV